MPSIKLTYFPAPGRAEASRLCFVYSGVNFDDNRIGFDQWGPMKEACLSEGSLLKSPSLPWLEVDGQEISQSLAVLRYAANVSGLAGKTSMEKAKVDMILCVYEEILEAANALFSPAEDKREEVLKATFEKIGKNLDFLEKTLKENNDGKGWFVGNDVTAADFAIFGFAMHTEFMLGKFGTTIGEQINLPCLKAHKDRVAGLSQLKDYLAKSAEIIEQVREAFGQ